MLVFNVTGGIGSGKSACLQYIEDTYEAYVLYADNLAKELTDPGGRCYEEVFKTFSQEGCFFPDGRINRKALAEIVFRDEKKLKKLNLIVHPAVREEIIERIQRERLLGKYEIFIIEAALLLDEGYNSYIDEFIYISTDEKVRIQRLMEGRGMAKEAALGVMASQPQETDYINACGIIIDNSGDFEATKKQIRDIFSVKYALKERDNGY